jgi:hypothetical protein
MASHRKGTNSLVCKKKTLEIIPLFATVLGPYPYNHNMDRANVSGYSKVFMSLRAILCTFQISIDFYFVPVGGGRGAGEKGGTVNKF